jgi:hypothetical protein
LNEYGVPTLVNFLGNIDVEIKVDEGPDTETVMGAVFDLLMALSQNNVPVPPAAIIEASGLPLSEKRKLQAMVSQPDPVKEMATKLAMAEKQADIGKTQAETGKAQSAAMLNIARAQTEGMPDAPAPPKTSLDYAQQLADINETNATADHKRANAEATRRKAMQSPLQLLSDNAQRDADRRMNAIERDIDRAVDSAHRNADRIVDSRHRDADRAARPTGEKR